jgi:hypothetical protein
MSIIIISEYTGTTYLKAQLPYQTQPRINSKPQIRLSTATGTTSCLDQTRNDSLAIANPILAKLLDIPTSSLQRTRQHSTNLIKQETPSRSTIPTPNHPEAQPLNPLTEIVRKQDIVEESILRHHVEFVHAFDGLIVFFGLLSLAAESGTADLAEVVVVEDVAEEGPAPDDEAGLDPVEAAGPVVDGGGAVAGEPAREAEGVG